MRFRVTFFIYHEGESRERRHEDVNADDQWAARKLVYELHPQCHIYSVEEL